MLAIAPAAQADDSRYALANGCFALRSKSAGKLVAKAAGGGYSASAADASGAEPLRMQATDLGRYLLYGKGADFVAASDSPLGPQVVSAAGASDSANWEVTGTTGDFAIRQIAKDKLLAVSGTGDLVLVDANGAGDAARWGFAPAQGCAVYPEVDVNATGAPRTGSTPYGNVTGLVDAHLHHMGFEFLGGSVHCAKPWDQFGAPYALVDCPDHQAGGFGAVLEDTISYSQPGRGHDPVGWPTFKDWPAYQSLTHEQTYYKWVERAWRGGLRVFVNLLVDNTALCKVYPLKKHDCNEMNTVRQEILDTFKLQDYIDAQNGGPGKGWYRVVRDPFEARRVINQGKLAVVLGIEVSQLFDCNVVNDVPQCDRQQIDTQMDEMYNKGVRSFELVNKFDNALSGVAGDSGSTGVVVNAGNKEETGRFWQMKTCEDQNADRDQLTPPAHNIDALIGALQMFLPPGSVPVYTEPPHCNVRGLTDLGEYAIRRMIKKHLLIDPDHMSVYGRQQALSIIEAERYSGVVSSHSWSSDDAYPRIYRAGGFVAPYAGSSTGFVAQWNKVKKMKSKKYFFGFGYGADMNGFGAQGPPRGADVKNPVTYPFKNWDGTVTLDKQRSGERVYDINVDGVAHYGLYPDWIQDLRMLAGAPIIRDMGRGPEAYLQTWERAYGVPGPRCRSVHEGFAAGGNELGRVRLGATTEQVLRSTNQPADRPGRTYRWCVGDKGERKGTIVAVFTPKETVGLVASTAARHKSHGIGAGARASRLSGRATSIGSGLFTRQAKGGSRIVYGVKAGRVKFVALATGAIGTDRAELVRYLKLARLR